LVSEGCGGFCPSCGSRSAWRSRCDRSFLHIYCLEPHAGSPTRSADRSTGGKSQPTLRSFLACEPGAVVGANRTSP
jgi:hypothetical protein